MAFQPGVAPQTQAHGSRLLADVAIEIAELRMRSGEPIELSQPALQAGGVICFPVAASGLVLLCRAFSVVYGTARSL
jgi:hypothetical protein